MKVWNMLIFEGFIGSEWELCRSKNGKAYARIWVNNREKGQKDYELAADINVTLFGKTAENFTGNKGDRVIVRGCLQSNEYNNKKYLGCLADKVDVVWRAGDKKKPAERNDDDIPF